VQSLRRLAAQLAVANPIPPISVIDCLARIDHRDVVVVEQSMHSGMRGGVLRDRGRWLIVLNAADDRRRMRFTLAHELAHVALAVAGWDRQNDERLASRLRENLCDAFADDLLMPVPAIRRAWPRLRRRPRPVEATAACFDVAPSMARRRLKQLGFELSGSSVPVPTSN
jgi:Zn-dependent peptidase ImmA (M78 family)